METYVLFDGTAIINFNLNLFKVSEEVESDLKIYNVKNDKLVDRFLLYRLVREIIRQVTYCRQKGIKLLFFVNSSKLADGFPSKHLVIIKYLKRITSLLNICFLVSFETHANFCKYLSGKCGSSIEKRNTVKSLCNKHLKNPNFKKFIEFLNKNNIQKLDNITKNDTFKLGLFLT